MASSDDDFADLRQELGGGQPRYREFQPRRPGSLPRVSPWQVLLGGFLLASVTAWLWATIVAAWVLRGGKTCHPNPRFSDPPAHGCNTDVPPYFVVVVMTTASFAWLVWVSWRFLKGGPTGGRFFAIRALQERGEILYVAIIGGPLLMLLLLYGWAICWGPGGLIGQVIGVPYYVVGGGPRLPPLVLAAKAVIVFFTSVKIIGTVSISTQGS